MSTYDHLAPGRQRPDDMHVDGTSLLDYEGGPLPASAVCKRSGWQRRALTASFVLVVVGCACGASTFFAKPSLQPKTIHSDLAISKKFTEALTGEEPAIITWKTHPSKCWALPEGNITNGSKIHMSDCGDNPDKFLIPAGSTGPIKPARSPEFCLDAPAESTVMQLWECEASPRVNIAWLMPDGRAGPIKPANDEEQCVDVVGGNMTNGARMQQWECTDKVRANEGFTIRWPDDCVWDSWSNWTSCHNNCKDSYKTRERNSTEDGGAECRASKRERAACGEERCSGGGLGGDSAGATRRLSRALALALCLLRAPGPPAR